MIGPRGHMGLQAPGLNIPGILTDEHNGNLKWYGAP